MSARGARLNEPAQFADLDEQIDVSAVVTDAETASAQLTLRMELERRRHVHHSGASVMAGASELADVSDQRGADADGGRNLLSVGDTGLPVTKENRVSKSISVGVHDSKAEVAVMARQFLLDFSDSTIQDVNVVLRNFSTAGVCADQRAKEADDVAKNRREKRIVSFRVDAPAVTVNFGGFCGAFEPARNGPGDACALVGVEWHDVSLVGGAPSGTRGVDQVPAVYLANQDRWPVAAAATRALTWRPGCASPASRNPSALAHLTRTWTPSARVSVDFGSTLAGRKNPGA
jgi:hypothetical protein